MTQVLAIGSRCHGMYVYKQRKKTMVRRKTYANSVAREKLNKMAGGSLDSIRFL